ncbi:glycosyltransferase family 2 protein [Luteolibacter sp. Populi]|uniref:glycosyltransferase family 2 protein n=1 Tax=Luteolibacter sp. Populi TaxID=3230487 RepID=UPI0034655217
MVRLSITIPTYDRLAQLSATLQALFDDVLPDDVELVIIDNHSPEALEPELRKLQGIDPQRIRFIRNSANVGLAANVLRCFEVAEGDWVWTLSDDDPPIRGAVRSIMEEILSTGPNDFLLKFNSSNGGEVAERQTISDLESLSARCENIRFYSNLLFISSCVFRRKSVLKRLNVGYHWAYSLAPHVAMSLHAVLEGLSIRLVPCELVKHGRAPVGQQWNSTRLITGFTSLGDLEGAEIFAKIAMPKLAIGYLRSRLWRMMVLRFVAENERSPRFWRTFYARQSLLIGGWRGWVIGQLAWVLYWIGIMPVVRHTLRPFFESPVPTDYRRS